MEFIPGVAADGVKGPAHLFLFYNDRLLTKGSNPVVVPTTEDLDLEKLPLRGVHYLGTLDGRPCYCGEFAVPEPVVGGMEFAGLRPLFKETRGDEIFALAGRALQVVIWDRNHQYCGKCGTQTERRDTERARICPSCKAVYFPRVSPVIIVAVTKGDQILLAHGVNHAPGFYSVLAGFVEPGETLEECVRREIKEEVNLEVQNIRYFASQPWPFPHNLMVGFTAEYAAGEISIDTKEIVDARWFTVCNLPPLPGRFSIAWELINDFIQKTS